MPRASADMFFAVDDATSAASRRATWCLASPDMRAGAYAAPMSLTPLTHARRCLRPLVRDAEYYADIFMLLSFARQMPAHARFFRHTPPVMLICHDAWCWARLICFRLHAWFRRLYMSIELRARYWCARYERYYRCRYFARVPDSTRRAECQDACWYYFSLFWYFCAFCYALISRRGLFILFHACCLTRSAPFSLAFCCAHAARSAKMPILLRYTLFYYFIAETRDVFAMVYAYMLIIYYAYTRQPMLPHCCSIFLIFPLRYTIAIPLFFFAMICYMPALLFYVSRTCSLLIPLLCLWCLIWCHAKMPPDAHLLSCRLHIMSLIRQPAPSAIRYFCHFSMFIRRSLSNDAAIAALDMLQRALRRYAFILRLFSVVLSCLAFMRTIRSRCSRDAMRDVDGAFLLMSLLSSYTPLMFAMRSMPRARCALFCMPLAWVREVTRRLFVCCSLLCCWCRHRHVARDYCFSATRAIIDAYDAWRYFTLRYFIYMSIFRARCAVKRAALCCLRPSCAPVDMFTIFATTLMPLCCDYYAILLSAKRWAYMPPQRLFHAPIRHAYAILCCRCPPYCYYSLILFSLLICYTLLCLLIMMIILSVCLFLLMLCHIFPPLICYYCYVDGARAISCFAPSRWY